MRLTNDLSKLLVQRPRSARLAAHSALPLVAALLAAACGGSNSSSQITGGAASGPTGQAGTANIIVVDGTGGNGTVSGGGAGSTPGPYMLPADFTMADKGGYKLGPAIDPNAAAGGASAGGASATGCGAQILGVVRDFKGNNEMGGHPDFEHFAGKDASLGIVKPDLGTDQKPVYSQAPDAPFIDMAVNGDAANGQQTTNQMYFDEWYRNTANVNKPYVIYFYFEPNGGVLTFQSTAFFPLDGAGWGNGPNKHNFGFTTEVHTQFQYKGGETFAFTGDDDLWVFINHKLAIDLGGLHPQASKSIMLDAQAASLGISVGNNYDLDLFHAERHTDASDFRVDTNLTFTNCGTIIPDVPVK